MSRDRNHALSLAFMRGHPAQAAHVLETLPAVEAAALFEQVPARLGAGVLAAMLPHRAALCIGALADVRALELLAPMGTQPIVALLRHLPEPRRRQLVAGLPTAVALTSSLLLGYAEDTLGAWVDPDVTVMPADARAAQALDRMRLEPVTHPLVLVVDGSRRLAGLVGLGKLLHAPAGATLATLMQVPSHVLTAHAPLSGTPAHPGWENSSVLPVVEPGEHPVGVMTRDALSRALRRTAPPSTVTAGEPGMPALLVRGYWQALSGMLESGLALLPGVPALAGKAGQTGDPDGR